MIAAETEQGLTRLGVLFENTLPYSPYQNGKQEAFWGQVEGRLLPMLEGVADLTLDQLNQVSQPWVELEYNRKVHSEIAQTPLQRFLNDKNVAQPCPSTEKLQLAFTTEVRRIQRRSDGTLTLEGIRFEVPSRFGHLQELWLRYASWDLSTVSPSFAAFIRWTKRKMPKAGVRPEPPPPVHHRPRLPAWRLCSKKSSSNTPPPDCLRLICLNPKTRKTPHE